MNDQKLLEVISIYRKMLKKLDIVEESYSHEDFLSSKEKGLEHCFAMLPKMEKFLAEGRRDKVFRWLGFLQGFFWSQGIYSLHELTNHNKKD